VRHGRGTFRRRLRLFAKASDWNTSNRINSKVRVFTSDARRLSSSGVGRTTIVSGSSERMLLPDGSVDVILTDPPYHDDVQYHELSLPLRSWANLTRIRPVGEAVAIPHSTALSGHRAYRKILQRIFKEFHRVLKSNGRLLFSYANREPAAWVNLFAALRAAEFRPVGYTIVHSENEIDLSKRNGRACQLDLILELVPRSNSRVVMSKSLHTFDTDEGRYLKAVGDAFLDSFSLVNGWEAELVSTLRSEIFVAALKPNSCEAPGSRGRKKTSTAINPKAKAAYHKRMAADATGQ
jgi:putative DNA methylase